jgi:hypothetical protein
MKGGKNVFQFPAGAGKFSVLPKVKTGSGTYPAPYKMNTGIFPSCEAAGV